MLRVMPSFTTPTLLVCAALVASVVLLLRHRPVGLPILATVVAAFEMLVAFHLVTLSIARVPLPLFLGAALAIAGIAVWLRSGAKSTITAASLIIFVGLVQIVAALHLH
jgi:hypothetical protein